MKRFVIAAVFAASFLGLHGESKALTFTLGHYDVSLNDEDPGLVLFWNPILSQPASFDLEPGESVEFALFELGTEETYVNADDIFWKEISADFYFTNPDVLSQAEGNTRGRWLFQDGVVRWGSPVEFQIGDTGLFSVTLMDTRFDVPGAADVWAKLEYVREDVGGPAPVPEPATVLALGSGLMGMGVALRRKKRK